MHKIISCVLLGLFFLSACVPKNITPSPVVATKTPFGIGQLHATEIPFTPTEPSMVNLENDECGNPYFPVVNGAWWQYEMSTGASPRHSMAAVNKEFTITVEGGENVFTIDGSCTDDGIILLEVPGVSASYNGENGGSTLQTTNDDGVTLPNDVQIDDDWSQTISVVANSGAMAFSAQLETDYTAVGFEGVFTQEGFVNALKVEETGKLSMGGEVALDFHGYIWYGQGIGVVKNTVDGSFEAILSSYNIPQP
jgi:hypothetical protein